MRFITEALINYLGQLSKELPVILDFGDKGATVDHEFMTMSGEEPPWTPPEVPEAPDTPTPSPDVPNEEPSMNEGEPESTPIA